MAITRTPWTDDDGTGTTGTILNNAEKQLLYNQIDGQLPAFTPVPFLASDFYGGASLVWTVGAPAVIDNRYALIGNTTMLWRFYLSWFSGSNVLSGTPSDALFIKIPGGRSAAGNQVLSVAYAVGMAGVPAGAGIQAGPTGTAIRFSKFATGNFALSDIPGLVTMLIFEVV